ncbi:hypothetical protein [Shinella sp.]|uniref:hypothetical protein n=1 Tax=Shinella sp. TaxID=1870904 RepID=UPI0029B71967|nr:hypothetical protein [Shinella sp.]MDX3977016.1 hypothetical protein [Shinella sp.]
MAASILISALSEASEKRRNVDRIGQYLAHLMGEIHGGAWRVEVNHDCDAASVLVVPADDKRPIQPKPEVA